MVAVERRVLERLRHRRAGELLHFFREAAHPRLAVGNTSRLQEVERERVAQEVEQALIGAEPVGAGLLDRGRDQLAIERGGAGCGDVGAVDREMQHVQLEGLPQRVGGKVARRVMATGDPRQKARQHGEFAEQQRLQHAQLGLAQHRGEFRRGVADLTPDLVERIEAPGLDQHLGDGVEPFIARGAMNAGEIDQLLVLAKNLLDQHVKRLRLVDLRVAHEASQPLEILRRVVQPVDVVEPQALQLVLGNQTLDQRMDGIERAGVFDAQAGQRVDVEKPPVVDLAGRQTPLAELVVLTLEEIVQGLDLRGAVCPGAIGIKPFLDQRGATGDGCQFFLEAGGFREVGMAQALVTRGECEDCLAGRRFGGIGLLHHGAQDLAVALRGDRQAVLEIPRRKAALGRVELQLDLAGLQCLAVGSADDRQQNAAAGAVGQGIPIDVERNGVRRRLTPFEHAQPPRIVGEMHADMVRHEVQDQADIVLLQFGREALETFFTAQLGIELGVVDDVVAVRAAGTRLQERRGIQVRDAQRFEIGHDGSGVIEGEIAGELEAVGGNGDGGGHDAFSIRQSTDHGATTSETSLPQRLVPGKVWWLAATACSERLASKWSTAPSPIFQCAFRMP